MSMLGTTLDLNSFQIEKGSTATEYEPPTPTPDYPIAIHSLNDFDVVSQKSEGGVIDVVEIGGRNLIKSTDAIFSWSGELNITTNSGAFVYVMSPPYYPAMYQIEARAIDDNMVGSTFGWQWDSKIQGESIKLTKTWQKATALLDNRKAIGLRVMDGLGLIELRFIKAEKGNKATEWTPAPEDIAESDNHPLIDKINLLLSEPLRSVGDVKDRLFRDSDGLWKVERKVGVEILNRSTELFMGATNYNGSVATDRWVTPENNFAFNTINTATSHFRRVDRSEKSALWGSETVGHVSNATNQFHINFSNDSVGIIPSDDSSTRTTKIRDWLQSEFDSGTPVVIQYELANPTIKTLDQELQDKLNNLRSFQDSNYVYTIINDKTDILSENLKPTLHAKFLYNNWYKEDRVINNLMIYNRALTNEEMLQNYKTIKRRWGM